MENRQFRFLTGAISVIRRCSAMLIALISCTLFLLPAAAETETVFPLGKIDLQRRGTLHIVIKDNNDNPVPYGSVQLYNAAEVTAAGKSQYLKMTAPFSEWGGNTQALFSDQSSAEDLAAFVKQNSTPHDADGRIRNGEVTFSDLAPGVYLVMQASPAHGYENISPFLAFLPQTSDSDIVYDIQAQPKEVKINNPGCAEIQAQKQVKELSGKAPEDTLFSFVLTPESADAPLPENGSAVYDSGSHSMTVSRRGAGKVNFGLLQFDDDDIGKVYTYSIREVKGTAAHYTYDTTVYKMTVHVDSADGGKTISVSTVYSAGKNGGDAKAAVFRNVYDAKGNTPDLPNTGQLWWPVFVMTPVGALFIVLGIIHYRRGKREEAEDAA